MYLICDGINYSDYFKDQVLSAFNTISEKLKQGTMKLVELACALMNYTEESKVISLQLSGSNIGLYMYQLFHLTDERRDGVTMKKCKAIYDRPRKTLPN